MPEDADPKTADFSVQVCSSSFDGNFYMNKKILEPGPASSVEDRSLHNISS